jgi:RNA polymerase sigma factor (sigma-70 family)
MADANDMQLLQDYYRQGLEEAFAALVERHINLVYSVALRHVRIAASAEEITQAVFIILARKAAGLRPATVLESWFYETTRLTALSYLRGEQRRQRREQEAYMQSTLQESPDVPVWNQLAPLLDEAMARLQHKDREAVILRFFKEKHLGEVAAALRVSEAAAQSRVHRAVDKLRKFLIKRGVVLTTAAIAGAISANSVHAAPAALAKSVTAVAITKGATASGSTLILIKGALKLMAYAKAKTAFFMTAVALLGTGTTLLTVQAVHVARAGVAPDIQGAWEGVGDVGGPGVQSGETSHTRIVLKISKTNGVYGATADVVDLGIKDIRLTKVRYDFPTVHFDWEPWTSFEATVNAEGTELTFPGGSPVVMERTNAPDTVQERFTESDYAPRAGSALQGCWAGDFRGQPVYWKIAESKEGTFRGELDNPLVGENHKPFSVSYHRPDVTLTVLYGTGIYQGQLNGAGTEITGYWLQRGKYTPITLKRVEYQPETTHAENEYAFRSKTDLQGHWKAVMDSRVASKQLNLGELKRFPVNLDIAKLPDGTISAALVLPLTAFMGLGDPMPASDIEQQLSNVRVEWKKLNALFSGSLNKGKLTGTLRLFGASVPLTFERQP